MAKHNIDAIARVCHEANRAYCHFTGDAATSPLPGWDDLEESYRQSTRVGVLHAIHGDDDPASMHEAWVEERTAQGWKWGEVLDREKKIHPNLVDYGELPADQRRKDRLFGEIVKALTVRL